MKKQRFLAFILFASLLLISAKVLIEFIAAPLMPTAQTVPTATPIERTNP